MKVLICPLNWGLGHATRSSPIVEILMQRGHEVHLASDGLAKVVLSRSYPQLPMHSLAPLTIVYGKSFWIKLFSQILPFIFWLVRDHIIIRRLQKRYQFDLIISDSRPSCFKKGVYSTFISNQTSPILPNPLLQKLIRRALIRIMHNFDEVWIPDLPGDHALSGELIQVPKNIKTRYLGFLSRLAPVNDSTESIKIYKTIALVSGPEPMRSDLEDFLKSYLHDDDVLIVGGRPDQSATNHHYIPYLSPTDLSGYLSKADKIISRGGYSSLLDFTSFNKRLILIPTPGQPEQNYLAQKIAAMNMAVIWDTRRESWDEVKSRCEKVQPFYLKNDDCLLEKTIHDLESRFMQMPKAVQGTIPLLQQAAWVE